jgi:ribonuclease P protein component
VGSFRSDQRLRKGERLQTRAEFKRAERRGKRVSGRHLVVYAHPNSLDWSRLGITVTRKVGPANRRNRWKRRVREIFRRNKADYPAGYDYVVIVRKSAPVDTDFDVLRDEMVALLNRAAEGTR